MKTTNIRMSIMILDGGEHGISNIDCHIPMFLREIERSGDIRKGLEYGLRYVSMFGKALFAVNGKYFVVENKPVYLGKNGERSRIPFVGCTRIFECSLKPIEHRAAERLLALDMKRQIESLAKVLEEFTDAQRAIVGSLEALSLNLQRVHNKTIHNR